MKPIFFYDLFSQGGGTPCPPRSATVKNTGFIADLLTGYKIFQWRIQEFLGGIIFCRKLHGDVKINYLVGMEETPLMPQIRCCIWSIIYVVQKKKKKNTRFPLGLENLEKWEGIFQSGKSREF